MNKHIDISKLFGSGLTVEHLEWWYGDAELDWLGLDKSVIGFTGKSHWSPKEFCVYVDADEPVAMVHARSVEVYRVPIHHVVAALSLKTDADWLEFRKADDYLHAVLTSKWFHLRIAFAFDMLDESGVRVLAAGIGTGRYTEQHGLIRLLTTMRGRHEEEHLDHFQFSGETVAALTFAIDTLGDDLNDLIRLIFSDRPVRNIVEDCKFFTGEQLVRLFRLLTARPVIHVPESVQQWFGYCRQFDVDGAAITNIFNGIITPVGGALPDVDEAVLRSFEVGIGSDIDVQKFRLGSEVGRQRRL